MAYEAKSVYILTGVGFMLLICSLQIHIYIPKSSKNEINPESYSIYHFETENSNLHSKKVLRGCVIGLRRKHSRATS